MTDAGESLCRDRFVFTCPARSSRDPALQSSAEHLLHGVQLQTKDLFSCSSFVLSPCRTPSNTGLVEVCVCCERHIASAEWIRGLSRYHRSASARQSSSSNPRIRGTERSHPFKSIPTIPSFIAPGNGLPQAHEPSPMAYTRSPESFADNATATSERPNGVFGSIE